jgi:hypothetical protein
VDEGLVLLVIQIADDGIQGQKQCQDENDACNDNSKIPSFHNIDLLVFSNAVFTL